MKNCSASLDMDILFKGYEWDGQAGFIAFFLTGQQRFTVQTDKWQIVLDIFHLAFGNQALEIVKFRVRCTL